MKRILFIITTALLFSVASAVSLPENATVTLISEGGVVVGIGELVEGDLSLTLEVGANGFVSLLIEGEGGASVTLDGLVNGDGEVLVVSDGDFVGLSAEVEEAGGRADVAFSERIAQGLAEDAELPTEAVDGIATATENQAAALENAADGQANAGGSVDVEAEGSAETGDESSAAGAANADASVELDVNIGEDAAEDGVNRR